MYYWTKQSLNIKHNYISALTIDCIKINASNKHENFKVMLVKLVYNFYGSVIKFSNDFSME